MLDKQMHCPVCLGSSLHSEFVGCSKAYTDAILIKLNVSICGDCRSFYLKEYVKEEEIVEYYPSSYYTKNIKKASITFGDRVRRSSYALYKGYPSSARSTPLTLICAFLYGIAYWHRLGRFPQYSNKDYDPRILEIGYGGGGYLVDLKNMGWNCFGIDVDESSARLMADSGIDVARDFGSLNLEKEEIDYIYSYHAFEHIYDIESTLQDSFNVLSGSGKFLLCVPVSDGFLPRLFKKYWYDLGVPIHKQIFSVAGMHALADRHGFKISSYKYNSYSESFVGSIVACFIGLLDINKAAQSYSHGRLFKLSCLLVSPIVLVLDFFSLGDRAEFLLTKK